jgi:hypothetical protein
MKKDTKYKMVQLPEEIHKMLKEYCNHHGFKLSGFLSALIRREVKGNR